MTSPITDAMVEAGARALHEYQRDCLLPRKRSPAWDKQMPEFHEHMRSCVRRTLEAALPSALAAAKAKGFAAGTKAALSTGENILGHPQYHQPLWDGAVLDIWRDGIRNYMNALRALPPVAPTEDRSATRADFEEIYAAKPVQETLASQLSDHLQHDHPLETSPLSASEPAGAPKRPVAFRAKRDDGSWFLTDNEALCIGYDEYQGLYVRGGSPEPAGAPVFIKGAKTAPFPDCMMPDGAEPCKGYRALMVAYEHELRPEPAGAPSEEDVARAIEELCLKSPDGDATVPEIARALVALLRRGKE